MDTKSPFPSSGEPVAAARPSSPFRAARSDLTKPFQPVSCVTRETSQEDCARHRFIVWAAVKRNSCSRMTPDERLECPLLRCTQRFPDHESMLQHLAGCEYLASGEYWCYDHMRVERFDDVKCKRCLGHPSKRRKMLSIAKSFFHSLGHKSKKGSGVDLESDDVVFPPPPSYDSLNLLSDQSDLTELSASELPVEIDSTELGRTARRENTAESLAIRVPELDSTTIPSDWSMQWQPIADVLGTPFPIPSTGPSDQSIAAIRPSLQVTTIGLQKGRQVPPPTPRPQPTAPRSKALSPSSSVRSNASTNSNVSAASNVSSLVSPVSNWSGAWSIGSEFHTNLTTPIDLVSPVNFITDHGFAGASSSCNDPCPDLLHGLFSELPADIPDVGVLPNGSADDLLLSLDPDSSANSSYSTNAVLDENPTSLLDMEDIDLGDANACCSGTEAIVVSVWDALREHLASSILKIEDTRGNRLADQLRSMSIQAVAAAGLNTLRHLVDGQKPTSAIDTLCFVHLVYAFSLTLHEQETSKRSKSLFLCSLSYAENLASEEQDMYAQIVREIWQPADLAADYINASYFASRTESISRSSSLKGKQPATLPATFAGTTDDALLTTACNFLNYIESSVVLRQAPCSPEVQASDLYMRHLLDFRPDATINTPFSVTVNFVLSMLLQDFVEADGLATELNELHQRVSSGVVSSVRRVELELLDAGKSSLNASQFFDSYAPDVKKLCDQFYEQHESGTSRRAVYHKLGILMLESIISDFESQHEQMQLSSNPGGYEEFFSNVNAVYHASSTAETMTAEPVAAIPMVQTVDPASLNGLGYNAIPIPAIVTTPAEPVEPQKPGLSSAEAEPPTDGSKVEANASCEICGYRPKGAPQWFKGSMAKHKKLQHSTAPPKIYKCPYPGCTSQYKNRPDNLRQHQIEKGHFAEGEESTSRRPSKRKKTAQDDIE